MTDIGVYTTKDTLEEKIEYAANPRFDVWWVLSKEPKSLPEKVFFAAEKEWKGFFTIAALEKPKNLEKLKIYFRQWHELDKKTERSQFQGFTYRTPEVI